MDPATWVTSLSASAARRAAPIAAECGLPAVQGGRLAMSPSAGAAAPSAGSVRCVRGGLARRGGGGFRVCGCGCVRFGGELRVDLRLDAVEGVACVGELLQVGRGLGEFGLGLGDLVAVVGDGGGVLVPDPGQPPDAALQAGDQADRVAAGQLAAADHVDLAVRDAFEAQGDPGPLGRGRLRRGVLPVFGFCGQAPA